MNPRSLRAGLCLASLALAALLAAPAAPAAAQDDPFPWPGACQDGSAALGGTILDEAGDAVAGAQVLAAGPAGFGEAESGEDGAYQIAGLCAGEYQVAAYTADAESAAIGFHDADGDGEPDLLALEAGQSLAEVDIVLSEMEVSIVIEPGRGGAACEDPRGSIAGVVLDESGEAVDAADVSAHGPGGFGADETDENGRYRIEGLCAGDYEVSAIAFADHSARIGFHDADGDGMPDPVSLGADDAALEAIDIVLGESEPRPIEPGDPGSPVPPACEGEGSISGAARLEDGAVASGADVLVVAEDGSGYHQVLTDEDGGYELDTLCDGTYVVVAVRVEEDGRLLLGAHDADGDGEPDLVELGPDGRDLEGVDLVLTSMELPLSGALAEAVGGAELSPRAPAE